MHSIWTRALRRVAGTKGARTLHVQALLVVSLIGAILMIPATSSADRGLQAGTVSICQVTGSASAPNYA